MTRPPRPRTANGSRVSAEPTEPSRPPIDFTPAEIEAYAYSMDHHSKNLSAFAFGFVNIYAIFNAGAFAAIVAIIPTDWGKSTLTAHPYISSWILGCFAVSFLAASALMAVVFQYSESKYRYYRGVLINKNPKELHAEQIKFHVLAYLTLCLMLGGTILGISLSLLIILNR